MKLYNPDEDYPELLLLYLSWNAASSCPKPSELPEVGLLEPGMAAVFMYQVDADWCIFEHAITNRLEPKHGEVMNELVQGLLHIAKEKGYKKAYVAVANVAAIERAKKCGFVEKSDPYRCQLEREV